MKRVAVSLVVSPAERLGEVLLVERNAKLRFFGGYHAFPGGVLDGEDEHVEVLHAEEPERATFVVAGARELFEETGIWKGRGESTPEPEVLREDRRKLIDGAVSFASLLEKYRHHLDAGDFEPLCRITTSPFAPVRYDTWFLRCWLPEDSKLDIWPGELVGGAMIDPATALERWRAGEILVAPPNVIMMEEWAKGPEGLVERIRELSASYERGKLHRVYFTPGVLLAPLATPTVPPATHTNTCVIGEERLYVVDPSPPDPDEQAKLWELLDELVDEGRKLEGILLTHYHPDHVGALAETQERYQLPAYAHADSIDLLDGVTFERALEHGEEIELGRAPDDRPGWKLRVYHVPGHAPGHLAFHESRYDALIVGDILSTLSSILIDPKDGHLATYLESVRFLESVARGTVYPGHGPPARDGRGTLSKALAHRQEREDQLLAALSHQSCGPDELVPLIYADVDRRMWPLAERSLLSGLIKLEEEGRVRREGQRYRLA